MDALLDSLPTRTEMFMENVAKDTKRQIRKESRLTQDDCKNTINKRGNKIMKAEMAAYQVPNEILSKFFKLHYMYRVVVITPRQGVAITPRQGMAITPSTRKIFGGKTILFP